MKAVIFEKYGPPEVMQMKELPRPVPKTNEVLIRVVATTVHRGDVRMRIPDPFLARLVNGLLRPKRIPVLGMELAGVVEAVGADVRRFKPGDQVFAFTGFGFGTYAEYKCMLEDGPPGKGILATKPANISFEEAAAIPAGGMTALHMVRKAGIQPGQKVLIYGASGSLGSYALQLARTFGAQVIGVCSTTNLELVRSLGAEAVIDYTCEDFTQCAGAYDVIIDAVGKLPASRGKKALKQGGVYLNVLKDSGSVNHLKVADLNFLKELVEAGQLVAFIDRSYPLEQIVAAHRYVEMGHKRCNVAITIGW
jgi:NADPH:quinone reductase-like Zn-dependent oxidoreductase